MKNSTKFFVYLLLVISLSACGKVITEAAPDALLTQTSLTVVAELLATAPILPATVSPIAPVTPTATAKPIATPNPTFTPIMQPTIESAIAPIIDPAEIKSSLAIETLDAFNGHNLRRISGWASGFDGFEWMDSQHLLLYPIVGKEYGEHGEYWTSYPAAINLSSGSVWLVPEKELPFPKNLKRLSLNYFLPKISLQASMVVASDTDNVTSLYNLDGELLKTYQGKVVGISRSGNKMIVVSSSLDTANLETKWIDLQNNKEVLLNWNMTSGSYEFPIIWSPDEMSVYVHAFDHFYGNAKTSESFSIAEIISEEEIDQLMRTYRHSFGEWVLNDTYLLTRWNEYQEGTPGYVSFFDPVKQGYRNLSELAGLPYQLEVTAYAEAGLYPCQNGQPQAASGGRYVWVNCQDGGRLIDMQTFKAQNFPDYSNATLQWSTDGNFAWIRQNNDYSTLNVLSAASKKITSVSSDAVCNTWHPTQNIFAHISNNGNTLSIFNAEKATVQKQADLPLAVDCFFSWNASGNKIALTATDGSIWQIDTPTLTNLSQLTPPIAGAGNAIWSPDSSLVAFPAPQGVYIVDVK